MCFISNSFLLIIIIYFFVDKVKIQALPDIHTLPSDRESLFYYNVREIPPKTGKANTLQIALQTRIKLFWRPKALEKIDMRKPWQF